MNEVDEPRLLKKYLLGTLEDENVQSRIEERLMVDEEFAVRIGAAEDELIEEFLDGEMTREESDRFNRFFLAAPERKKQLRLTRDLRRAASAKANAIPHPHRSWFDGLFPAGWLRFAAVAAVVVIAALGVWRFAISESDTDRGLEQLQAAYRDRRPVESRITSLPSYAPYSETRGDDTTVTDPSALEGANRYLIDATRGSGDAAAHHALAMYYLARRQFDSAEREMNVALKADPSNARIQSDAGALYLEKSREARDVKDNARELFLLNDSLKHLNLAISLDSKLHDARFNRALCLQWLTYTEQAKAAWREYLELDPNSEWTEEARRHLQKLESGTPGELSAEKLEANFLTAFRLGDEAEAERLISGSRELIRDKYLPMRLAMSLLKAPEERRGELLGALAYVGNVEMKLTGDPFAKEIAHFYRTVSESNRAQLTQSHYELRKGMDQCLASKYEEALPSLQRAERELKISGDIFTARMAQYVAAYALKNLLRPKDAYAEFIAVETWARERKFSWLSATAMHWVAGCLIDVKELTNAKRVYEEALSIARRINDSYAAQRNLSALAQLHSLSGQRKTAIEYLFAAMKESDRRETSLRQRLRNFSFAVSIFIQSGLPSAGKPAAMELLHAADQSDDEMWKAQCRVLAAVASFQTDDVDAARALLEEGKAKSSLIKSQATRERISAFSALRIADLERSLGNVEAAERSYHEAIAFYDTKSDFPSLREQAHHGLLLTYLARGNTTELQKQIPLNIKLTEEYRTGISDESQSIGFFDLRANIYDIAAEFEFDRGNLELAYNSAETSSSRVLLDRMQSGAKSVNDATTENNFSVGNQPLDLAAIRAQMPSGVQLIQYSLFENKLVVWLIASDDFSAVSVPVKAKDLKGMVSRFAAAMSSETTAGDPETAKIGNELYRLLVEPVHGRLDEGKEICIVPRDFLFDLPFAALVDREGKPLIASFRLIYAPSANVFVASSRNAASRERDDAESLLAVGNPAFEREKFDNLSYLPDAEGEALEISKLYPRRETLLHREATKKAFLDKLTGADVVHIAGHYLTMPSAPMSSYLLMAADGDDPAQSELTNRELAASSIGNAKLIVLAACRSGVEGYYGGEGLAGMSRTVLAARVPLVVASQWNIDSSSTADLMKRFHELRQKESRSTTAALREAQLEMINDPKGRFSSPYYWAAFAVYGGHADF